MQRLWFPPGSASYKKADEIVAQDAWESTGCDVTQEANALTSAGERLRPHLQWISNTLPSAIWRLHQCNIEMNLRIKWGVKKYPVYSVPNQKIPNPNKTNPLNPLACHPQEENYKKLWHNLDNKRGQCRLAPHLITDVVGPHWDVSAVSQHRSLLPGNQGDIKLKSVQDPLIYEHEKTNPLHTDVVGCNPW